MLSSFGLITKHCLHCTTPKKVGERPTVDCCCRKEWRRNKTAFSHMNDAQSVANGDRWRVEIGLNRCDIYASRIDLKLMEPSCFSHHSYCLPRARFPVIHILIVRGALVFRRSYFARCIQYCSGVHDVYGIR